MLRSDRSGYCDRFPAFKRRRAVDRPPCDGGGRDWIGGVHPPPTCIETSVSRAPALDCVLSVNWQAAIGTSLAPSVTNWFDDPVRTVNAVGNELFGGGKRVGLSREGKPIRPGPPLAKPNAGNVRPGTRSDRQVFVEREAASNTVRHLIPLTRFVTSLLLLIG
jgi:hypothetical protein